jgi:mycofactocin system transcriptional regulator
MTGEPTAGPKRSRTGRPPSTTRQDLERVAFALFDDRGFDETSVDDIAAAAGIARRTFFRYYPSKFDLVWGDFDGELGRLRASLQDAPPELALLETVRRAVIEFNQLPTDQEAQHRRRLALILGVPSLLANSTLRFAQWRDVIADYAAGRLDCDPQSLLPAVIGHTALGAAIAAYEQWLRRDDADLAALLGEALGELATGFRRG